jgi:Mrp family chromosome partitioning ATPase
VFNTSAKPDFVVASGQRGRIIPMSVHVDGRNVKIMSLGLIIPDKSPVLWSEDASREAVTQMLELTEWDADYLIIDCPPGSGPEVQTIVPKLDYAIIVTIPSKLAFGDVARAIEMMREYGTPIIGEVRNMDRLKCECGKVHRVFHDDVDLGIPVVLRLPIDSEMNDFIDLDDSIGNIISAMESPTILKKHSIIGSFKRALFQKAVAKMLAGG